MDLRNPPQHYWHCGVRQGGKKERMSVVNDLSFAELKRTIVDPCVGGKPFSVSGLIVRSSKDVSEIRISWTQYPQKYYADLHNQRMRASNIADMATDRRTLVFGEGEDLTFELLFSGDEASPPEPDTTLVERLCKRLPQAARVLANRSRKGRQAYEIADEYDVQDLLHGILRAYLKYSVQEDPLPKVAGAKSSRADISIEELKTLIEIKYVRGPEDQRRLFDEYSQDLVLYAAWPHLETLIYLIYNSSDLKDAEAFERLAGNHEVNGRKFKVQVVLS
jgi:hypothetical protein